MRNKSHTGVYRVSWQEQLRNLDEELASGRLSADEYRQRRDQVLTSAVTPGDSSQPYAPPSPPPGTPPQGQPQSQPPQGQPPTAESTQIIAPVSPSRGFPQQNAPQANTPQQNSEATQVVRGPDPSADRTQAVQGGWPATAGDADRTQVVPGGTASSPPGGIPMGGHRPQQPTWNTPDTDASPPWGGSEFPPLPAQGPDSWITQGPEVFGTKSGGKGKIIGIVVAVLVLAGLGVGAFLIWGQGSSSEQAGPGDQTPPAASSQAPPPAPPDPLPTAKLAGQAEAHPEIKSMADIPQLNYLGPKELEAYNTATSGAGDTKVVVYHLTDGSQVVLMLTEAFAPAAAQDAVEKLKDVQVENGAKTDTASPVGVQTTEIGVKGGQPAQVRGHYVSGSVIVRVDVANTSGLEAAKSSYETALAAQLSALPSNG